LQKVVLLIPCLLADIRRLCPAYPLPQNPNDLLSSLNLDASSFVPGSATDSIQKWRRFRGRLTDNLFTKMSPQSSGMYSITARAV